MVHWPKGLKLSYYRSINDGNGYKKEKTVTDCQGIESRDGDDQGIPFSEVASRSAYIPQVRSPLFSYPLIACNSELIDEELFDW